MLQLCSVCCDCVRSVCCCGTATHPVKVINSVQYVATESVQYVATESQQKNKKLKTLKNNIDILTMAFKAVQNKIAKLVRLFQIIGFMQKSFF